MTEAPSHLAALGTTVPLADGSELRLRFTFLGLAKLEDEFGSLLAIQRAFTPDGSGPIIRNLVKLISAATDPPMSEQECLERLDPKFLDQYMTGLAVAFRQAFPEGMVTEDPKAPQDHRKKASRSRPISTLPPSSGPSSPASSGA